MNLPGMVPADASGAPSGGGPTRSAPTSSDRSRPASPALQEQAAAAFLADLPGATRQRLRRLLRAWPPTTVVEQFAASSADVVEVLHGCSGITELRRSWAPRCATADLDAWARSLLRAGAAVWWAGDRWDRAFADDLERPGVLFTRGDHEVLDRPRVAIVGTRRATFQGREMAKLLGRQLADAGVAVVSGLALGIDAAAHLGALGSANTSAIAVVGSGVDIVYPRQHARLWGDVAARGLVLSEAPLGRGPTPSAFPERNRIIAQLATVVVVVESHAKGGSLITVDRAFDRGRRVMAVPGSPLSLAAAGSNALLRGSCDARPAVPCLGADDVLALLDLDRITSPAYADPRPTPNPDATALLALMGWESWPLGRLVVRSGRPVAAITLALAELEADGWIVRGEGRWHRVAMRPW